MSETNQSTFKYYRQEQHPKMTKIPSLKLINPLTESRLNYQSKEDHAMMSEKRIGELADTYNKEVVLNRALKESLKIYNKGSEILSEMVSF